MRCVPSLLARPPVRLLRAEAARVPRARSPGRSPTGSTSPGSSIRSAGQRRADLPFDQPERARRSGRGCRPRASGNASATPHAVAAQRAAPGPMLRDAGRSPRRPRCGSTEVYGGRLTRRGAVRVHRVAWSVADLAGVDRPGTERGRRGAAAPVGGTLLLSSMPGSRDRRSRRERSRSRPNGSLGCALPDRRAGRPSADRSGRTSWGRDGAGEPPAAGRRPRAR